MTRAELLAARLSSKEIRRRVEKGVLLREFPGVYRVGHRAPSVEARYMAAVKACGEGAVVRGRAGAFLHRLMRGAAPVPEVAAPKYRKAKGVKTRRERIDRRDVMKVRGITVTRVARTLVDLAADLDEDELARACHEAGVLYGTTPRQVEAVLARRRNAKGAAKLRRVVSGDVPAVLSKLEAVFIARLRKENLPLPKTNKPAGGNRVDCRWPEHNLTVELLSYQFHNSRYSWEQDHERRRRAYARKDAFRTYTWKDVREAPAPMLEELKGLLSPTAPSTPRRRPRRRAAGSAARASSRGR